MKNKILLKLNKFDIYFLQNIHIKNKRFSDDIYFPSTVYSVVKNFNIIKIYYPEEKFLNVIAIRCKNLNYLEKYINKINILHLSENFYLTDKFIEKYIHKDWNYELLSLNQNIPIEFIEKYINKPWNYKYLSGNPTITTEFIEKYINADWNLTILIKFNSNKLSNEIIKKLINK